jgi:methylenetetrahydrofolate dehydrogenase (NADP+) / methenyltetrahydrofolate cyclohydrolase
MDNLLNGRQLAKRLRSQLKQEVDAFKEQGIAPGLAVVLVGDDPASQVYIRNKERACQRLGISSQIHPLPADTSQQQLHKLLGKLSADPQIHGVLLQLPLPKKLNTDQAILQIAPAKDVDGLHPLNLGRLFAGLPGLRPCTPLACLALLDSIPFDLAGKRAVVVGRSLLVGKPLAHLLLQRHATVTLCHSRTRDLAQEIARAEVVIAAAGSPELIRGEWIASGTVVLDVGTNAREDGSLVGDVDFAMASERALAITPVPGGVGPMTITMLLSNTIEAARDSLSSLPES